MDNTEKLVTYGTQDEYVLFIVYIRRASAIVLLSNVYTTDFRVKPVNNQQQLRTMK
jgi:hypothetical protein